MGSGVLKTLPAHSYVWTIRENQGITTFVISVLPPSVSRFNPSIDLQRSRRRPHGLLGPPESDQPRACLFRSWHWRREAELVVDPRLNHREQTFRLYSYRVLNAFKLLKNVLIL